MLPPRGRSSSRRLALGSLLAVAFAAFVALGSWQVERRAWKIALIDRVAARVDAAPVDAPVPARWLAVSAASDEYRHVRVVGRFMPEATTLVQAVTRLGAGFWVLTPLRTADGSVVLVNRGFVESASASDAAGGAGRPVTRTRTPIATTPAAATASVTGLLRLSEPGGAFLRHNDPAADRWYSRDVAAIARTRRLDHVAPYFIDADAAADRGSSNDSAPVGGLTVVAFANNHLVYALTWYTLAALCLAGGWQLQRERPGRRRQAIDVRPQP